MHEVVRGVDPVQCSFHCGGVGGVGLRPADAVFAFPRLTRDRDDFVVLCEHRDECPSDGAGRAENGDPHARASRRRREKYRRPSATWMRDWTGAYRTPSRGRNPSTADVTATAPTPSWVNRSDPTGARASNPPRIGYRTADRFRIDRPLRAAEAKERRPTAEQTDLQFVIPPSRRARDRASRVRARASRRRRASALQPGLCSTTGVANVMRCTDSTAPSTARVLVELHARSLRRDLNVAARRPARRPSRDLRRAAAPRRWRWRVPSSRRPREGEAHVAPPARSARPARRAGGRP